MSLKEALNSGKFAVTAEAGPPKGTDIKKIVHECEGLVGKVDAVNVTDNQSAVMRISSTSFSKILIDMGLEPILQMTCRDRNRISMQSDILGASALGLKNLLCLTGDHQKFGDHPNAKGVFDIDSIQLVGMVKKMRDEGKFIAGGDSVTIVFIVEVNDQTDFEGFERLSDLARECMEGIFQLRVPLLVEVSSGVLTLGESAEQEANSKDKQTA